MDIKFKKLVPEAVLPECKTSGAAGMDLVSVEAGYLEPGQWHAFTTGLAIEIPEGFEGQVRSRSGLALKQGLAVLNAPGTIDSDYRGEVKVILVNHGSSRATIMPGDRIAQLVIAQVPVIDVVLVDELSTTDRGAGGFGSTGK